MKWLLNTSILPSLWTQPGTKSDEGKPTAGHRVLEVPELRDHIIAHCSKTDYHSLRRVNHAFAESLNAPLIWRDEYAPAEISWPLRTIYASVSLDGGLEPQSEDGERLRKSCALGNYKGEPWTLETGLKLNRQQASISDEILDEVASITASGHGSFLYFVYPGVEQQRRDANRDRAYAFLLDRNYRLKTGQSIATYRKEVFYLLALTSIFIGVQYLFYSRSSFFHNDELHGRRRVLLKIGGAICFTLWLQASIVIALVICICYCTDMILTNLVMGPLQRRKLNAWALQAAAVQGK